MISIPVAHTLDAVCQVLGEFSELSAWTAIRQPTVTNPVDGRSKVKMAPDQVVVTGTVADGVVVNAHFGEALRVGPTSTGRSMGVKETFS
jgi:hypothetical protein